jgi:hypothetical protein
LDNHEKFEIFTGIIVVNVLADVVVITHRPGGSTCGGVAVCGVG